MRQPPTALCETDHCYEDGEQTGCPFLSMVHYCDPPHWLARKRLPPCETGECGMDRCHRFKQDGPAEPHRIVLAFREGER